MEVLKFVKSLENNYNPVKKEWVASAISGAVGLASSLIGGISASDAAEEAERRQKEAEAMEKAWYLRRYNQDYADTAAGQNLIRRAKEFAKQNWKKASGAQAVAGGTDAATAQAKEAGNRMVGETIANIAAQDTARKDRVDDMHRRAEEKFTQMDIARENQRAANITNAAQQASNAIMSVGSAIEGAGKNLEGASNNGKPANFSTGKQVLSGTITGTPETITAEQAAAQGVDADLVNEIRKVNG